MSWRVLEHFTIYRERNMYAAHPNIVRTKTGDLLVVFHRSPFLGHAHHSNPLFNLYLCRSVDDGKTWGSSQLVTADQYGGVNDFGTHTLPNGTIFIHAATIELVPSLTEKNSEIIEEIDWISRPGIPFWIKSFDHGVSWSEPKRFPQIPDAVWGNPAEHSGISRSGLLSFNDGRMILPSKATGSGARGAPYFGMIRESKDMGNTWGYGGRIIQDPVAHFSEPAIHITPTGRILALYRCHPQGIFAGAKFLALVYSDDGGNTWSKWRKTAISGSPGHMLKLKDGRIFITVGTRWEGQMGCLARVLDPEAKDIDSASTIVVRSDSKSRDCGYPWAVELNDEKVLVVYYYHYSDNHRGIEASIIEEF